MDIVSTRPYYGDSYTWRFQKLRKMPDVDGPVRVVAIGDFDYSACGGTHVARARRT